MRDSAATRARILQAAAELFVEHGYGRTTFAMISQRSGAAIGSISYQVGDKAAVAKAVVDDQVTRLIEVISEALHRYPKNVKAAIQAMLLAYQGWSRKFPSSLGLVRMLEEADATPDLNRSSGMNLRLGEALAAWLRQFGNASKPTRSPSQLYAILLAPAMSGTSPDYVSSADGDSDGDAEWIQTLTEMATVGLGFINGRWQRRPSGNALDKQPSSSKGSPPESAQRKLGI